MIQRGVSGSGKTIALRTGTWRSRASGGFRMMAIALKGGLSQPVHLRLFHWRCLQCVCVATSSMTVIKGDVFHGAALQGHHLRARARCQACRRDRSPRGGACAGRVTSPCRHHGAHRSAPATGRSGGTAAMCRPGTVEGRQRVDTCPWHPGFPPSGIRFLNGPSSTLPRFRA